MVGGRCDSVLPPAPGNVRVSQPARTLRCMGLQFNRVVSKELVAELRPEGRFDGLVRRRHELSWVADVQLRRAQGPECHASLYIGLTSVLNVRERGGLFALSAHKTHRAAGGFDPSWSVFRPAGDVAQDWPAVEAYLDQLLNGGIDPRWYRREGVLHALLCSGSSQVYGPLQREASPWADGPPLVRDVVSATSDLIWVAHGAGRTDPWWPGIRNRGVRKPMGDELDVLAVDEQGRLLCMEAKPAEDRRDRVVGRPGARLCRIVRPVGRTGSQKVSIDDRRDGAPAG